MNDTRRLLHIIVVLLMYAAPVALLITLKAEAFHNYITLSYASLDGYGHFAAGTYYAEHLFPRTWGWVHAWSFGMPFPVFYPPLPHLMASAVSLALEVPVNYVLNTILIIATLLIPGLGGRVALRMSGHRLAGVLAALAAALVLATDRYGYYGVVLAGTFGVGLSGQLISFFFALLWLPEYFTSGERGGAFVRAALTSGAVVLSNVHMIPVIVIVAAVDASASLFASFRAGPLARSIQTSVGGRITSLVLGAGLTAFWWLPALMARAYQASIAVGIGSVITLSALALPYLAAAIIALAAALLCRQRSISVVAISSILLLAFPIARIEHFLPNLPIHAYRYTVPAFIFALISIAAATPLIMRISRYQTKRYVLPFTALVLFILLSAIVAPRMRFGRYSPLAHYFDRAQIQRFADAIGAPKGSVLIEYDAVHEAESFAFGAELAARGTDVAFTILRESTPTSIFAIPIRNSFSRSRESAGVFSMLAFDEEFLTQPIETRIARAQMMGVSHVAVRSPLMKAALATTSMTKLVTEYGGWKVFQFADPAPRARVLQYKPVAVYSDLRFNSRTTETADYTRMVEEMMRRNQWDPLLVFPRDQQLDGNLTLQDFSSVIIEQYHYRNRDTAYRRLKEFVTGGGTLFVYRSDDPLYSMLTSLAREGDISIVERKYIGPYRYPREEYGALFDMLPLKSTNAQAGATPRATAEYTALSINVRISSTSTELPILVQTSFFPAWHRQGTSEPHLAGPNFMLAFADTDFRLNFEIPASVRVGILVSAASIIMLILSNFRRIPYTFRSGDSL